MEIAILSNVENGLGITAASLATLRPLLRQIKGELSSTGYLSGAAQVSSARRNYQQHRSFELIEGRNESSKQLKVTTTATIGDSYIHRLDDRTGSEECLRLDSSHELGSTTE